MTLDDLERRNSPYLAFLPILISLLSKYVAAVEYRPMLCVNIVFHFQSSTFGHNYPTLRCGLSAIAVLLVISGNGIHCFILCKELMCFFHVNSVSV